MKKRIAAFTALLLCTLGAWLFIVTPRERQARAKVNQEVFDTIKRDSAWDMKSRMLYGYFFVSEHRTPLRVLGAILQISGHRFVGIREDEENGKYWLHVEEIDIHDLDSISARDVRLKRLGKIIFGSEYDGWDVGPDLTPTKSNR